MKSYAQQQVIPGLNPIGSWFRVLVERGTMAYLLAAGAQFPFQFSPPSYCPSPPPSQFSRLSTVTLQEKREQRIGAERPMIFLPVGGHKQSDEVCRLTDPLQIANFCELAPLIAYSSFFAKK
jgi:hypothetical protein